MDHFNVVGRVVILLIKPNMHTFPKCCVSPHALNSALVANQPHTQQFILLHQVRSHHISFNDNNDNAKIFCYGVEYLLGMASTMDGVGMGRWLLGADGIWGGMAV
jgi:hypothetical protein